MRVSAAQRCIKLIPAHQRILLDEAHERFMHFSGIFTDQSQTNCVIQDRAAFPHLLRFTDEGCPFISADRCADFMVAVSGLPREWCLAWDAVAFVVQHGREFASLQAREQQSMELESNAPDLFEPWLTDPMAQDGFCSS